LPLTIHCSGPLPRHGLLVSSSFFAKSMWSQPRQCTCLPYRSP
jgi:hypothetical protein